MISLPTRIKYQIQDLRKIFFDKAESASLRNRFIKAVTGTFGLNVTSNGLLFATSIFLAHLLGKAGYGVYSYALAWTVVLSIPASFGLVRLIVRNFAAYKAKSAWSDMAGFQKWANKTTFFSSFGIALLSAIVLWTLRRHVDSNVLWPIGIALILLPLTALIRVRQAAMQGLYHLVLGQLPEMIFHPVLFIAFIGAGCLLFDLRMTAILTLEMYIVAAGISLIISIKLLRKVYPKTAKEASPAYDTRQWLSSALPMMFVSGMYIINSRTDILMLGAITGTEAVGIYNAASRGSELIMFVLIPVNQALSPLVAGFYAQKDFGQLQRVVTKSARMVFLLSLPIAVGLAVFGYWFLLLFGQDFTDGQVALSILSIGQLINIAFGPVAVLLIMTNYERDAALGVGIGAALNVVLNAFFIPMWGLEGAAIATISSKILLNILMTIWVYKRLEIHSTAFGRIGLKREK